MEIVTVTEKKIDRADIAAALGVDPTVLQQAIDTITGKPAPPPEVKAPDGGPVSSIRIPAILNKTCRVRLKSGEKDMAPLVIREEDFDPELHIRAGERKRLEEAPEDDASKGVVMTSENLKTLDMAALQRLPEYKMISDKTALKTKDDVVEAIMIVYKKIHG